MPVSDAELDAIWQRSRPGAAPGQPMPGRSMPGRSMPQQRSGGVDLDAIWQQSKPKNYQPPPVAGFGEGIRAGIMDPYYGIAQDVSRFRSPEQQDRTASEISERERKIRESAGPGFREGRMIGGVVSPPNLLMGGIEGAGARTGTRILRGALGGAAGGAIEPTTGNDFETEKATQIGLGAGAGGALGALPGAVRPLTVPPARQRAANILDREGIPYTAGNLTGRSAVRYAESHLGEMPGAGGAAERAFEESASGFNRWAFEQTGLSGGEHADQATMGHMWDQLHQRYDAITSNNDLELTPQDIRKIDAAYRNYQRVTQMLNKRPIIGDLKDAMIDAYRNNNGVIDGRVYQTTRSRLGEMARAAGDQPSEEALYGLQKVLDDAFDATVARRNPKDLGRVQELRQNYRNAIAIGKSIGRDQQSENITPGRLRTALQQQNQKDFQTGTRDMAEVVHAAELILPRPPQSGTAPRQSIHNIASALGAISGGTVGHAAGDPSGGVAAGLAGAFAPGLAGRALLSKPLQRVLKAQTAPQRFLQYQFPNAMPPSVLAPGAGAVLAQPSSDDDTLGP